MNRAFLFQLLVLFAALVLIKALENRDLKTLEQTQSINQALEIFYPVNIVKSFVNVRSDELKRDSGTKCSEQVTLLQEEFMKGSMWALKMVDASSKIPSGILMLNSRDLGMFDECVGIRANEGGEEIRGRHCMYGLTASLEGFPISETLSICLPASCEPEDVVEIVNSSLKLVGELVPVNIPIVINGATCTAVDPPEWTAGGIVTLVGFSLLLLFLVFCTICDIFTRYSSDRSSSSGRFDTLRQFSLYSNALRVLSTKTSPQTLPAIQGLRFFSMCWVLWGHSHTHFALSVNTAEAMEWMLSWNSLYIVTAPFSVDTFLAISGFLMSYIFLKEMSTGRRFNLFGYYLHRYLRLTPAFAALLLITIFILPRLGSGAIWERSMEAEEQACRSGWWTMLLYIHNYLRSENSGCMSHTWYLAVEMHLFWISPLILCPLAKKPKIGLCVLAAFFVASVVTPVIIGLDNKYSTAMIGNRPFDKIQDFMNNFYFVTHVRAAPWLIGIFFGYLVFTHKESSTSKAIKWIGWILTTSAFAFCVFSMRVFQNEDYKYDDVWEAFYTALARPLWSFAVSWVIYACVRGFGGPVSTFLSFSIYTPLSRISYCVYLVHYQIQYMKMRSARTPQYFSVFNAFDHFLSDLMLSSIVGFIFTIAFESPVLVLEKIVKRRRGPSKEDSKNVLKKAEVENGIDKSGLTSS